jgi:hypothetical protein
LFVAVAKRQIDGFTSTAVKAVQSQTGLTPKIQGLVRCLSGIPESRRWGLLLMEFSLFVLRHPKRKKHVASLYDRFLKGFGVVFEDMYKESDRKPPVSPLIIGLGFSALGQGLILQELLNSDVITPSISNGLLSIYLHAVSGEPINPR